MAANDMTSYSEDCVETRDRSIATRVERQLVGARLRVLIIGAGIAGATLGALLRQRGEPAAIIERGKAGDPGGYMLGLLPLGGRVLNGLGLQGAYHQASLPMKQYVLHDRNGKRIRRYPLMPLVERFGILGGIPRGDLLTLLRNAAGDIEYQATATHIDQDAAGANVRFDDGSSTTLDLIVAADGVHSPTRAMILHQDQVEHFDTGWGGFVLWATLAGHEAHTYHELWSVGWGIGLYPVPGRLGIFLAGRNAEIADKDPQSYAEEIARKDLPDVLVRPLRERDRGPTASATYWKMADIKSRIWWRDRTVLLGDAAAAFLPTAGVGASAAMDSAAALADELSRADNTHLGLALSLYEKRQRHRIELAQKNSRDLARFMFVNNPLMAFARDQLMRFYSLKRLIHDISKVMEGA